MTLHIISNPAALNDCLAVINPRDALLFRGVDSKQMSALAKDQRLNIEGGVYWLSNDYPGVQEEVAKEFKAINYPEFVELCIEHPNSVSWS